MYNCSKAERNSHAVMWCTSHTTFGVSMERVFGVTVLVMFEAFEAWRHYLEGLASLIDVITVINIS